MDYDFASYALRVVEPGCAATAQRVSGLASSRKLDDLTLNPGLVGGEREPAGLGRSRKVGRSRGRTKEV